MSVAGDYAEKLFGDASASSQLASIVVLTTCFVGIFVMPLAAYLGETYGLKYLMYSMTVGLAISPYMLLQPSWPAQILVSFVCAYINGLGGVVFGARAMAFAPPTKVGTVGGLNGCFFSIVSIPLNIGAQIWMASLPDPDTRFQHAFFIMSIFALIVFIVYVSIWRIFLGLPTSPILLPEEEEEICRSYGCKLIANVAYILHHEEPSEQSDLRGKLTTSNQQVHETVILCIDRERMQEMMLNLTVKELGVAILSGMAWRKDLTKVDFDNNVFGLSSMGGIGMKNLLNKVTDLSKFGKGSAKTVDQFESEIAKGRSR